MFHKHILFPFENVGQICNVRLKKATCTSKNVLQLENSYLECRTLRSCDFNYNPSTEAL